jgi:hypothetical protein
VRVAASPGVGSGSEVSSSGRRSGERRLAFGSARMDLWVRFLVLSFCDRYSSSFLCLAGVLCEPLGDGFEDNL